MKRYTKQITPHVAGILRDTVPIGNVFPKWPVALDRAAYMELDGVLKTMGGKWDRRRDGHVFPEGTDVSALVHQALQDGEVLDHQKSLGFFETPGHIATMLVGMAGVEPGMRVLEPSAGRGAIADAVRASQPDCPIVTVEIDEGRHLELLDKGYDSHCEDFLPWWSPQRFHRVLANPPFPDEVHHVRHMRELLTPNGLVATVLSNAITFRNDSGYDELRRMATTIFPLPEGTFRESGTMVNTVIAVFE